MAEPEASSRRATALASQAWAEVGELLDLQLSPLGLRAIEALSPQSGEVIVDVGCGAGQTVSQLAQLVGPEGRVIGVDIAPLLLDLARLRAERLPQVGFVEGDAQILGLPDESVDAVFSRFGVMSFADPVVAFSNFHRMLKSSGRLAFVCWRSLEENELDLLPLRAAGLEQRIDLTPFSFADPEHIRATLKAAGFEQITIRAHDEAVSSGDLDAMTKVVLRVGPLGKIVREDPDLRTDVELRVRAALSGKGNHSRVALKAATWIVTARA